MYYRMCWQTYYIYIPYVRYFCVCVCACVRACVHVCVCVKYNCVCVWHYLVVITLPFVLFENAGSVLFGTFPSLLLQYNCSDYFRAFCRQCPLSTHCSVHQGSHGGRCRLQGTCECQHKTTFLNSVSTLQKNFVVV